MLHETTAQVGKSRQRRAIGLIATTDSLQFLTIADLLESLGDVSATRVRIQPLPGTATERDVIAVQDRENRLCELVDGVLVEKVLREDQTLDGGEVLPGFTLSIREWFRKAERTAPKKGRTKR